MRHWGFAIILVLAAAAPAAADELWSAEATVGFLGSDVNDGYARRLEQFGYHRPFMDGLSGRLTLAVTRRVGPNLDVFASYAGLETGTASRTMDSVESQFEWSGHALSFGARASRAMGNGVFSPFAELGVGIAVVPTTLRTGSLDPVDETYEGVQVGAAAGFHLGGVRTAFTFRIFRTYAPVLENLMGDVHDVGGGGLDLGLRVRF